MIPLLLSVAVDRLVAVSHDDERETTGQNILNCVLNGVYTQMFMGSLMILCLLLEHCHQILLLRNNQPFILSFVAITMIEPDTFLSRVFGGFMDE